MKIDKKKRGRKKKRAHQAAGRNRRGGGPGRGSNGRVSRVEAAQNLSFIRNREVKKGVQVLEEGGRGRVVLDGSLGPDNRYKGTKTILQIQRPEDLLETWSAPISTAG